MSGIRCQVCGFEALDYLGDHILEAHGLTTAAYLAQHPGAETLSKRMQNAFDALPSPRREHPPALSTLTVDFAGVTFPVYANVPAEACLPRPPHYVTPKHGELGEDIQHLAVVLADQPAPAIFVHGEAGCGKDAAFHEWSGKTRRPGLMFQMIPGTDIQSWFFTREFDEHGTRWEEGPMLKALRDGYRCADGTVVPYLILITDFDRADRSQAEYLRLIMDSIRGRVVGPNGTVHKVIEGTLIAATANSAGAGDTRGRYISANPLDASILDRFEVGLHFHQLDWNDEAPIVQAKFPLLAEKTPGIFPVMGRITTALRKAISNEELYAEFSHRALCAILRHATRLVRQRGNVPKDLLKQSVRVWLDKLPDDDVRQTATNIMDPHIKGGTLNAGDVPQANTKGPLARGF